MLLPIKLLYDQRPRKDGTNAICIQYCYQPDKRTLSNTEIYIPSRFWNRKLSIISNELPEIYGNTVWITVYFIKDHRISFSLYPSVPAI